MKIFRSLVLILSSLLAVFMLAGCISPTADTPAGQEPTTGTSAILGDVEPFTVAVTVGDNPETRSVAGPDSSRIKETGLSNIRNFFQLIVIDSSGKLVALNEVRRTGDDHTTAELLIKHLPIGQTYHFLLLMGYWDRIYGMGANYAYTASPPTLLATGLKTQEINGSATVMITMYPLVVDTKFTNNNTTVAAAIGDAVSLLPVNSTVTWTIQQGANAATSGLRTLVAAQKVWNSAAGDTLTSTSIQTLLNGAASTANLTGTNKNEITRSLTIDGWSKIGTSGSVNFNLTYIPFNLSTASLWSAYNEDSFFTLVGTKTPEWIIRNGVNNTAQNAQTTFDAGVNWANGGNGNGAVKFKVAATQTSSTLKLKDGSFLGPATTSPKIKFSTEGYDGTAEWYYAVVAAGGGEPALSDYLAMPSNSLGVGSNYEKTITVSGGMASNEYNVYVILFKNGQTSKPLVINNASYISAIYNWDEEGPGDNSNIANQDLLTVLGVASPAEAIEELHRRLNNDGGGTEYLDGLKLGMYLDLKDGIKVDDSRIMWKDDWQNLRIVIASFNQYKGQNGNTKNHIKFVFKNIPVNKQMRSDTSTYDGYPQSDTSILRFYLENQFLAGLKTALGEKDYFYNITRTITGGYYSNWQSTDFSAKIFIDTATEVFGSTTHGHPESEATLRQTPLYKVGGTAQKRYGGEYASWWLGSPDNATSQQYFCTVNPNGDAFITFTTDAIGVVPAFCIY
jgi:hypothetical protein